MLRADRGVSFLLAGEPRACRHSIRTEPSALADPSRRLRRRPGLHADAGPGPDAYPAARTGTATGRMLRGDAGRARATGSADPDAADGRRSVAGRQRHALLLRV